MEYLVFREHVDMLPISQNTLTSGSKRKEILVYTSPLTAGEHYKKLKAKLAGVFGRALIAAGEALKQQKCACLIFTLALPNQIGNSNKGKTFDLDNFAYPIFESAKHTKLMDKMQVFRVSKSKAIEQNGFDVIVTRYY
ncbi:hypothetical protein [uncultured Succinivibrio sp.]|uniref:hypothetical protein n=1 Tax=uncultured Succinivibrio sp. TaxID=540749 RepID=UPI0025F98491|nr:hypothetical protein [uncultured Succinivibrio sp.]